MSKRPFTFITALFAALLLVVPVGGANTGGGANNVVLVQATADGSSLARAGVQVASAGGPAIASANIAEATSSDCTGCSSSAVAVQAVFITGDPDVAIPGNAAVATNAACTDCTSFAYAYQYVLSTGGGVYLSADARATLNTLRGEMTDVAASSASTDDKTAQLDALAGEFKQLIDTQLQSAGRSVQGTVVRQVRTG